MHAGVPPIMIITLVCRPKHETLSVRLHGYDRGTQIQNKGHLLHKADLTFGLNNPSSFFRHEMLIKLLGVTNDER
jgi:hypothetical protein